MNKKIQTIFVGTPVFAVNSFKAILNDNRFEVVAIITAKDKKIGRKQIVTPPPVKELALKHNIRVFQPNNIKDIKEDIMGLNPDVAIVVAYGKIFKQDVLNIPKYGFINVHGSILPKYRGAAVIQAPIINGDDETGITIIKMDAGLDTGPLLNIKKIKLEGTETAEIVHDKLSILGAEILPDTIADYISEKIVPQKQVGESSYIPTMKKEDGKIDWSKDAKVIERLNRGLSPWPGTYTKNETQILKIIEIDNNILDINKYKIGEVFLVDNKLAVQCGKDAVVINRLQEEGKKPTDTKSFLNGHHDFIGKILT